VAQAILARARGGGAAAEPESYLHAANQPDGVRLERRRVRVVERPPLADLAV
jgi:hypothetical protein